MRCCCWCCSMQHSSCPCALLQLALGRHHHICPSYPCCCRGGQQRMVRDATVAAPRHHCWPHRCWRLACCFVPPLPSCCWTEAVQRRCSGQSENEGEGESESGSWDAKLLSSNGRDPTVLLRKKQLHRCQHAQSGGTGGGAGGPRCRSCCAARTRCSTTRDRCQPPNQAASRGPGPCRCCWRCPCSASRSVARAVQTVGASAAALAGVLRCALPLRAHPRARTRPAAGLQRLA